MKLKSKAGVPIGTIAIIIVVLIAGIGMYWYFTQRGPDCSDVNKTGNSYWMEGQHPWYEHEDRYAQISQTESGWKLLYVSGGGLKGLNCNELRPCIDQLYNMDLITDDELKDFNHIADCIKAGCPECV